MRVRVQLHPAYVLHCRPWSETSLLVDVLTRSYGRFRVLAKGARRLKTGHRGELLPFQKLTISWSGKQLPTLTSVEMSEVCSPLRRTELACGFYMNELLFKLLHRDDAHESLFDAYGRTLQALRGAPYPDSVLRIFECELLQEVGFGLLLDTEARNNQAILPTTQYHYYPELGPVKASSAFEANQMFMVQGDTLLQLAAKNIQTETARSESKRLIRGLMTQLLRGETMRSRRVFESMLSCQRQSELIS